MSTKNYLFSQWQPFGDVSVTIRKITCLILLFLTVGMGNVYADSVEFTYASSGGWSTTAGAQSGTKSGVTIAATRGAANANNEDLRTYANYEFTVSSSNTISKIEFTFSQGTYALKNTSPGTWNTSTKTWTGSGTSITFTCTSQVRMTYIKVTYTSSNQTCVLYNGANGASTVSGTFTCGTTQLPSTAASVAGTGEWTFAGIWSKSHINGQTAYPTNGTYYSSGATNYTESALYAVYYSGNCYANVANNNPNNNTWYSTKPAVVYSIENFSPGISGGASDDYFKAYVGSNEQYCAIEPGTNVYLNAHVSNATGRTFSGWTVVQTGTSTAVSVTNPTAGDGTAYFEMPSHNVDITANFCTTLTGQDLTVTPSGKSSNGIRLDFPISGAEYYKEVIKTVRGTNNSDGIVYNYSWDEYDHVTFDDLQPLTEYWVYIQAKNTCISETKTNVYEYNFTTDGYIVLYSQAGEDITTSVPDDDNEYGANASVTLLDKNSESHKSGYYFAGWTDNSSGTGTVYKPGDTYTITGDVTFYAKWVACSDATTPSSLSVSGSGSSSITFSWGSVTGATKYQLALMDENSTYYEFETTSTSKTINLSDVGPAGEYMGQVRACNGTIGYCYEDFSDDIEFVAGCPAYQFHYQHGSDWNTDPICFTEVSSGSNDYLTDELSLPYAEWYNVTWQGVGQSYTVTKGFTGTTDNIPMPFFHKRDKSFGANPQSGNLGGGLGRFHVYHNSGSTNKYVSFIPTYYTLNFGTGTGDTWTNDSTLVLSPASNNWDETAFYTPITTLTDAAIGRKIFVGLKTTSGYVWCSPYSEKVNLSGLRTKSGSGESWVTGGLTTSYASKRGKFRIYANSGDANWYVTFIPHHRIIFHSNYPGGGGPADTYSVDVSVEETNSSIALASAPATPTGYTFAGWFTASTGGIQRTGNQTISAGATVDTELFAQWAPNTNTPYVVKHYQQNLDGSYPSTPTETENLTGTTGASVTPGVKSYTGFIAPSTQTVTILADGSLEVTYQYTRDSYTLTWVLNGGTVTVAGTCAAVDATGSPSGSVLYGASITTPTVIKTGYNLTWSSTPASTMPAANTTYTANWTQKTYTVTLNDGSGSGGSGSKTVTYNANTNLTSNVAVPTYAGHDFRGYYTAQNGDGVKLINGSGAWQTNNAYIDASGNWVNDGSIELHAYWTAYTYDNYRTTCCSLKPVTSLAVGSTAATSVTLTWTAPSPTTGISKLQVINASNDNVEIDNIPVGTTTATVTGLTECDNYTFKVVSYGSTCTTESEPIDAQPFSGAKTVTYNYHDGTGSPASVTTACGSTFVTLPTPTKDNHRFDGWYDAATSGNRVGGGGDSYTPTANITLHAYWTRVYTVTYEYNGGSGSCEAGGPYAEGASVTTCSSATKLGSTLTGWTRSDNGATVTKGQSFTMGTSDVTLTAVWEDTPYTLTQNVGSHTTKGYTTATITSGATSPSGLDLTYTISNVAANDGYALPKTVTISGGGQTWTLGTNYTWTLSADKHSATLHIGADLTITADVTVTVTEQARYTVVWDEHGSTTTEYYAADDNTVTLKTGIADCGEKKFYGWTEDAEFVSNTTTPPTMASSGAISGNKHYYAIYADAAVPANPGYNKITSYSNIVDGGTYLIVAPDVDYNSSGWHYEQYAYAGDNGNSKGAPVAVTFANDAETSITTKPASAKEVELHLVSGQSNQFTLNYDDSHYLKAANSNDLNHASFVDNDGAFIWNISSTEGHVGAIQSYAYSSRYLSSNKSGSGTGNFACYGGTQADAYLYLKETTTYSNFAKTCTLYDIEITNTDDGTVTTAPANSSGSGNTVTVNVTPNSCKYLSELKYNDGSEDHAISIASAPYTFTMPASDVTVTATFADKTVSSIAPVTSTHRTLMQGTAFVREQIRVTYNNGETEDLAWDASGLTFSGYNMSTLGNQTVSVAYVGSCGSANTSYSIEITDGIPVTFSDCGITTVNKYEPGETVPVKSTLGEYGCSGWAFDGWSETPVVHGSTAGYTIVENFSASVPKTLYAVYVKKENTYTSIDDADELLPGFQYAIMRQYSYNNHMILKAEAGTGANAGYLVAVNEYDNALSYSSPDYTLTSTEEKYAWQLQGSAGNWVLYNKSTNKYLDLSTAGNAEIESTIADRFTITQDAYDDHLYTIRSNTNTTYYLTYNSSYYKSYTSAQKCDILRRSMQFSSTPPCAPQKAIFHGNGGTVTASTGSPAATGADLTIFEATRDAGITTPTAAYTADCGGRTWSFLGWSSATIDVTRVQVLPSELLAGNTAHSIGTDGEQFYAVYSNTGSAETKNGTITLTYNDFNVDYSATVRTTTKTVTSMGDYTFKYVNVGHQSGNNIQLQAKDHGSGEIYNSTSLGKINSISFSNFQNGSITDLQVYVGDAEKPTSQLLTSSDLKHVGTTYTYYPPSDHAYLYIKNNGNYVQVESIAVDFGKATIIYGTTPDCKVLTLSGDIRVTGTGAGDNTNVKSVIPLTIFGNELDASASVTLAAYNVSDNTVNSHFSFSTITKDGSSIPNQNITVIYNPSGETTDGIENVYFKAVVGDMESNHLLGYGRHLPAKFVIATKIGDNWYGLPNNITTSSYGAWDLSYPLIVDDADDPTTATIYTGTPNYLAWGLDVPGTNANRYKNDGEKLYFASAINSKGLAGNATGLRNSAGVPSSDYATFAWIPSTTDLESYTLQNGSVTTHYIATNGSDKWNTATTGATVRFLTYNNQDATVTWVNESLGSNHLVNAAENGVITLPGTNPSSCEPDYFQFCGWKEGTIATYANSAPTYISDGAIVTPPKIYYAVYKPTNIDRWYTKCPTYHTITYSANGGVGDDHDEYTVLTTATAITVETAGFSKEGCTFVGWTNPADENGTIIYPNGTISGINSDITLNAVWIGTTAITGTVRLTASAGETVATSGTEVTISSTDFACATALRIIYKDITNDVTYGRSGSPIYTSSEFRLCNGSYGSADGSNISLAEVSGAYNQTFSITYKPNGGANTLDHYQLKIEVLLKNTVIETKTLDLYGRTLPEHFAIATKIGGSWYALPNNMASSSTYNPVLISVTEDDNVLNWTAQGPATVGYTMKDYTVNYSKLRFAADDANGYCLWAAKGNEAGIRNYSASSTEEYYAWTLTETNADFNAYTLDNKPNNTRDALKIYNNKWTMYNSGGYSEIHFIPLTTVETIDIIAREWKTNGLIYSIMDGNATTAATYKVGNVSETTATLTKISTGGYGLYEVGVCDLSSHYGKVMTLKLTIGGNTKYAYVKVPIIVSPTNEKTSFSTTSDAPFSSMLKAESAGYDVVILGGTTLTTDATDSKASHFNNMYVYPGATLVNSNASTNLNYLELRAGIPSYSSLNGELKVPHVYMTRGFTSCTNGANLDMYVDVRHDYALSVPFAVNLANVKYANALNASTGAAINGTLNSHFRVSYYSAEQRATTGKGWVDISSTETTLSPGTGYVIQAKRPSGQPLAVLRFPFTANPTTWANTEGEVTKSAISISGYGCDDSSISDNNKGWNLIANPYSANVSYAEKDESSFTAHFTVGWLDEESVDDRWTGKYVYKEKNNAYVTIPNDNYTVYTQKRANAADVVYEPFKNFFIQASSNTGTESVTFDRSYRQQAPAILRTAAKITNPLYVDVDLAHGTDIVTAGLTIDPEATEGYKFGEDQNIFENRNELNYLKLYTIADGHYLVGNTLTPDELAMLIPVEFYAPDASGEYVFSLNDGSDSELIESLILFDSEENTQTNLLQKDYHFTVTAAGFIENRFTINVTIKDEQGVSTDIDNIGGQNDKPQKFIYHDKMYIMNGKIIYDATGKKVSEINK